MSIVLDEFNHRHLVAFGDAGAPVLREIARADALAGYTPSCLHPNHGTHRLSKSFNVEAVACVSQNGSKRHHLWSRHCDTHSNRQRCYTTASGNRDVGVHRPWCVSDQNR